VRSYPETAASFVSEYDCTKPDIYERLKKNASLKEFAVQKTLEHLSRISASPASERTLSNWNPSQKPLASPSRPSDSISRKSLHEFATYSPSHRVTD
jgi:hypothetical protein